MTLKEIVNKLGLTVINGEPDDTPLNGVYAGDFLSRAMSHVESGNLWITIMSNANVIAVASLTDCLAVLLAEDVQLLPDALNAARNNDIVVLSSGETVFRLCADIDRLISDDQ